ncbi:hypothetical protein FACS1894177_05570 [Bacteroidia bacterium]|nr:hypothetical protein FACS1894177_05570 [Bacteroidia bacterium]
MLNSLYIKNYRNLKELKIDSVDQINLITGKNNTGKSSLLEAIYIYATKAKPENLLLILESRGENYQRDNFEINSLSSFFTNHITEEPIKIGITKEKGIDLNLVKYIYEEVKIKESEEIVRRKKIIPSGQRNEYNNSKTGLDIRTGSGSIFIDEQGEASGNFLNFIQYFDVYFIRSAVTSSATNEKSFDRIVLTTKENYVIEALKIIEPKTERIGYVAEDNSQTRKAVIKLSDQDNVIPLQSMGDGINRILTIILSLINAENGFLLIDEFENGLHYTVQKQLWKIIFKLAKDLNVQVFATTHSNDCISSFSKVLNEENNEISGKLIRLDNINGIIQPEIFSPEELNIVTKRDIEIR